MNGKQTRDCTCGCANDDDCTGSNDEEQSCTVQAPKCTASWSCTSWSSCVNGAQTRVCTCSCADNDCSGDSSESKVCILPPVGLPNIDIEGDKKVGDRVTVDVTDGGLPADGTVTVTGPDGSSKQYQLHNGKLDFTPDQPGVWTITYTDSDGNTITKTITVAAAPKPLAPPVITPEPAPVVKAQGGEFPWMIVAVVVALLVAFFLLYSKKRRRKK